LADGHFLRCSAYLSGDVTGKRFEILEQHPSLAQVRKHPTSIGEKPPRAAKSNAIKAMKKTRDTFAETVYKSLHNVAFPFSRVVVCKRHSIDREAAFLFFVVAALPR
jgi:hypothetical protein